MNSVDQSVSDLRAPSPLSTVLVIKIIGTRFCTSIIITIMSIKLTFVVMKIEIFTECKRAC